MCYVLYLLHDIHFIIHRFYNIHVIIIIDRFYNIYAINMICHIICRMKIMENNPTMWRTIAK